MTTSRPEHTEAEQAAINAALRSGIEQRNSDLVERALKNGADPNILMFAGIARKSTFRERFNAWDRREPCNPGLEWVNLAIAQGADVNAVNPDQRDDKGRPMPAIFCAYDHYKDHGESTEITELLLNNGANVNATNSFGNTSLIYAVSDGRAKLVEYYLAKGANPMHPCEDGIFPLQLLQESTRFNDRDKTKLLALMMKSISERPVPATTDKAPDQSAALAPQEVALERDVEIQKPLVLRPHKPPPLRLKL